jgi:hypothetical protein
MSSPKSSAHVKQEKPAPPPPAPSAPEAAAPPEPARRLHWSLRMALFLWASSFIALFAYELLTALVRLLGRLFGKPS